MLIKFLSVCVIPLTINDGINTDMEGFVNALKSIAEPTRLRILNILLSQELTVSEITEILNYSQPRISRHLKLMCDAGVLVRVQEGSWVFYRVSTHVLSGQLARNVATMIPQDSDIIQRDLSRLIDIRKNYARKAQAYFEKNAETWDEVRKLYFSSDEVNRQLKNVVKERRIDNMLDLGTGTGKMLELLGPYVNSATGIDNSQQILSVARSVLAENELTHCQVRLGDIFDIQLKNKTFDLITIHHVLHYLKEPQRVLAEAARLLKDDGQLMIVDFKAHHVELLRDKFAHRRLGFSAAEVADWAKLNRLKIDKHTTLSRIEVEDEIIDVDMILLSHQ